MTTDIKQVHIKYNASEERSNHLRGKKSGFLWGNRIENVYRDVKVNAIAGVSEEIMRNLAMKQFGFKEANRLCGGDMKTSSPRKASILIIAKIWI